jgi:hypothetical protein
MRNKVDCGQQAMDRRHARRARSSENWRKEGKGNRWVWFGGVQLLMGNNEITIMSASRATGALQGCRHLVQNLFACDPF